MCDEPTNLDTARAANPMQAVVLRLRELLGADTARISSPLGGRMFLIIGHRRNTKEDPGRWEDGAGNRWPDWDYVAEKVVAAGDTEAELIASAHDYKRLCGMTMAEHLGWDPKEHGTGPLTGDY